MPGAKPDETAPEPIGDQFHAQDPFQIWVHTKVRLEPRLLIQASPWVRSVFDHAWAPMRSLSQQISCLPPPLWNHLASLESGFVLVCAGGTRYAPGTATVRHREVRGVAFISVEDLAEENERPLHVVGHLIDHQLGCAGEPDGPWLSDGGGTAPRWQKAGARLPHLFSLGYGVDEIALANTHDYFAQSLALYCRDSRRLNIADPQIYKWMRSTLWSQAFWGDSGG